MENNRKFLLVGIVAVGIGLWLMMKRQVKTVGLEWYNEPPFKANTVQSCILTVENPTGYTQLYSIGTGIELPLVLKDMVVGPGSLRVHFGIVMPPTPGDYSVHAQVLLAGEEIYYGVVTTVKVV